MVQTGQELFIFNLLIMWRMTSLKEKKMHLVAKRTRVDRQSRQSRQTLHTLHSGFDSSLKESPAVSSQKALAIHMITRSS